MPFCLKKLWYLVFQFFFNLICYILPWRQPEILDGAGSVKKLPALIKSKGINKVLVVTDAQLMKIGLPLPLLDEMKAIGLEYVVFDGVEPNPSIENIEAARRLYLENACEALVAFGGGSSMDCAKACGARVAKPHQSIERMGGQLKVLKRIPLLFAIPTTAGTGSETTLAAVVTDRSTHHKYAINDFSLIPRYAVLDPELTKNLPRHITSTTGMDALTHAVEAFTNRHAPKYTNELAIDAVKLIFQNLELCYNDGSNMEARLARLAESVSIDGANDREKAQAFIAEIRAMNRRMDIPETVDCIKDEDIPLMIKYALKEGNPVYPVPEIWDYDRMYQAIEGIRTK